MAGLPRIQSWHDSQKIGDIAVSEVTSFLTYPPSKLGWHETVNVTNVEHNSHYQKLVVDLLWKVKDQDEAQEVTIEVKGDQNYHTGNFFLESVSDTRKNTPGSFVSCQAEWLFYFFTQINSLYCFPMTQAKAWLEVNKRKFLATLSASERGQRRWITKGYVVPIEVILKEITDIKVFCKKNNTWLAIPKERAIMKAKQFQLVGRGWD